MKHNKQEYHIGIEDVGIIASFKDEIDRDLCIEVFKDRYPDCTFQTIDEEKE